LPAGSPADAPLPTWGNINFVTATISYHGVSATGSFVVDTGSQLLMLSHAMASTLGLDLTNPIDTLPIEGAGGTVNVPVMAIDTLSLTTDQGPALVWKGTGSNPLALGVLDIAPGIDGVLGADLLTAGLQFDESTFDITGAPYFNTISLDYRNVATQGTGKLVFDLNPQYYTNIDTWAGPATGGDWSNAANWSAGTPSPGNIVLMQSSTPATMNNDLGNGYSLGEISTDGSFTLAGNSVVLDAAGGVAIASVEGNSTFGLQTRLGSDGTVQVSAGQLSITAPLDNNAHQLTFDVAAGAKGLVTGPITGAGGLLKTGGGTLTLKGTDNYAGGTVVTGGTLVIAGSRGLPDGGSLTLGAGGTFVFDPSATASVASGSLAMANSAGTGTTMQSMRSAQDHTPAVAPDPMPLGEPSRRAVEPAIAMPASKGQPRAHVAQASTSSATAVAHDYALQAIGSVSRPTISAWIWETKPAADDTTKGTLSAAQVDLLLSARP